MEYPWIYLLELDPLKKEIAYNAGDQWTGGVIRTTDLGDHTVRLHRQNLKGKAGNVMAFGMAFRKVPGITIKSTRHFTIHNVTMYHAGGMGVIAQYSSDLLLDSFIVKPAPDKDRVLSLAADATHFVNCSGYIKMQNCVFANQTDDATNIHGVYYRIEDILPDNQIMVRLVHQDQYGYDYLRKGLKLEFVNSQSLKTYAYGKVRSAYFINDQKLMVKLSDGVPENVKKGDVIAGCAEYPSVLVKNCYIGNNRARGLLLGSRNRILIENNTRLV